MSSLPTYRYQPLESASTVRILVLHPAEDFAAPIRVRIVHADQEALLFGETETQGYEAVSYCWGDPTPTHSIICDDAFTRGVTRNVDTMLRYLRRAGRPRRIWVDALCLNQQDLEEKTEQVRRMGRVYQCAMKVHVWLGETDKADPEVRLFAGLRAIAALRLHPTEEYEPVLDILGRVFGGNYEAYIDSFFSRKWFSRRWIVQECALNHQVVVRCGRHKILWAWFKRGVFLLDRARVRFCQEARDALSMVMSFDSPTMNAATLSKLLWSFHASECSLPEDRIFSLLGLAQD
ncbi:HET-domain-containing protein, partial [Trematosphaeria pertusa]